MTSRPRSSVRNYTSNVYMKNFSPSAVLCSGLKMKRARRKRSFVNRVYNLYMPKDHHLHICVRTRYFDMVQHMWSYGDGYLNSSIISPRAIAGWERGCNLVEQKCAAIGPNHYYYGYSDEPGFTAMLKYLWLGEALPPMEFMHYNDHGLTKVLPPVELHYNKQ